MNYIEKIKICNLDKNQDTYLNELPVVKNLINKKELNFDKPVTFFTGDNGAGKSTLIEAIAIAFGFNPEGGSKNFNFSTYNSHSILSKYITIKKGIIKPKDVFFLRAESFYNIASYIEALDQIKANEPLIKEFYGGKSLHNQSHPAMSYFPVCSWYFAEAPLFLPETTAYLVFSSDILRFPFPSSLSSPSVLPA